MTSLFTADYKDSSFIQFIAIRKLAGLLILGNLHQLAVLIC